MQNDAPNPPILATPSIRRRMACWLYEGMLLFGVVFTASYFFSVLTQTRHALHNRLGQQVVLFLALALYFCWCWRKGQTLAMKTWHIKVLDTHGQPLSYQRAVLRYILGYIWFLPPLLAYPLLHLSIPATGWLTAVWVVLYALLAKLNPKQQFWHDTLAGTQLVTHHPIKKPAKKSQGK